MTDSNVKNNYTSAVQYGWKCPVCGAVMAPWQNACVNCPGKTTTTINYEPIPWWANPYYKWNITCNTQTGSITTGTSSGDNTISNITTTSNTLQDKLKDCLKTAKINI